MNNETMKGLHEYVSLKKHMNRIKEITASTSIVGYHSCEVLLNQGENSVLGFILEQKKLQHRSFTYSYLYDQKL